MSNKTSQQRKKQLQNKADKLFQEIGRMKYKSCAVCGKEYSCLHHFHPKSMAAGLRYDLENGVPLCAGCHLRWHSASDPNIGAGMVMFMTELCGEDWEVELRRKREILRGIKTDIGWYKVQIELLEAFKKALSDIQTYEQRFIEQLPSSDNWKF